VPNASEGLPDPEGGHSTTRHPLVHDVLRAYLRRLDLEDSVLTHDPSRAAEVERQVVFIIEDVIARTEASATASMRPTGEARLFSVEVGANRARTGVHPSESLRAATLLFQVALPVLARAYAGEGADRLVGVSSALHEAVMDRVALASLSYVDFLIDKVQASRQEERRRIARELHDRVGHGMGLTLQHLDLYQHYTQHDPARAQEKLASAMFSLTEALRTVQQLSAELRRSVGDDGIERALQAYLRANVPPEIAVTVNITGDVKTLPPNLSEELYLILREATRNAVRHAAPTALWLTIDVGDRVVIASVRDNGRGFEPAGRAATASGGLPSMNERAELLRGSLRIEAAPGRGTTVKVRVPIGAGSL
jgi:signal transduction histidine kinase